MHKAIRHNKYITCFIEMQFIFMQFGGEEIQYLDTTCSITLCVMQMHEFQGGGGFFWMENLNHSLVSQENCLDTSHGLSQFI